MLKEPLRLGVCLFHNRLLAEAFNSLFSDGPGKWGAGVVVVVEGRWGVSGPPGLAC